MPPPLLFIIGIPDIRYQRIDQNVTLLFWVFLLFLFDWFGLVWVLWLFWIFFVQICFYFILKKMKKTLNLLKFQKNTHFFRWCQHLIKRNWNEFFFFIYSVIFFDQASNHKYKSRKKYYFSDNKKWLYLDPEKEDKEFQLNGNKIVSSFCFRSDLFSSLCSNSPQPHFLFGTFPFQKRLVYSILGS